MDIEIYRKQYDFEMEQRNGLASAINIPIVALTIVGGALSSLLLKFKFTDSWFSHLFLSSSVACTALIVVSVYYLSKSFIGYVYDKIAPSSYLADYYQQLYDWNLSQNSDQNESKRQTDIDFENYMKKSLSEASEANGNNNLKRGNYLHGATATAVLAFIFLMVSSAFYVYQKANSKEPIHQVQIAGVELTNCEENNMTEENKTTTSTPKQSSQDALPSKKPEGPGNWQFRGNFELNVNKAEKISPTPKEKK